MIRLMQFNNTDMRFKYFEYMCRNIRNSMYPIKKL